MSAWQRQMPTGSRPSALRRLFRQVGKLPVDQTDRGRGFDPREDRACALELRPCAAEISKCPQRAGERESCLAQLERHVEALDQPQRLCEGRRGCGYLVGSGRNGCLGE